MAGRILDPRAADLLMPTVIAQQHHHGVAQRAVTLQSAEKTFELDVQVAERRHVAIGLCSQRGHVRIGAQDRKRMVGTRGEAG